MGETVRDDRKSSDERPNRAQLVAYLQYVVQEVAGLSPSSATLLVAAIDDLQQSGEMIQTVGNDIRRPS